MGKSLVTVIVIAGISAVGCEMTGGMSDNAKLTAALGQWKAAIEEQDLDKMMEPYSEDYEGERGEGREGVRRFLERVMDEGALEDVEMDVSEAEIKINGDKATVGPIVYTGDWGEIEMTRILKKESDGVWRVVGTERY